MKSRYQIRIATEPDLQFIQDIERSASALFPVGRIPDLDDVMPMHDLRRACARRLVLVASRGEVMVGFAMSKEYDDRLHLAVMAVHPDHGRRGLGTEMVRAVIKQAERRGLAGVTLTTFQDIAWNAPFYGKLGFRILNDTELDSMLRETLAHETSLGMTHRVGMLYVARS